MPSISHHMDSTDQSTVIIRIEITNICDTLDQYSTYVLVSEFSIQSNFKKFLETYGNLKSAMWPFNQVFFLFINLLRISLLFIHFFKGKTHSAS